MRNFLKLRRNREFEYKPRYYKGQGNPYKIEHKLDKFRTTAHQQRGLKNKLSNYLFDGKKIDFKAIAPNYTLLALKQSTPIEINEEQ